MQSSNIIFKDLVLIGGGHAHVHTIKMMGMKPVPGVRVTLVTRDSDTPYSGMLPGYVAGYYSREECHIDLRKLCSFSNTRLIHAEASGLDTSNKLIHFRDRPSLSYDIVSIDIGITPKIIDNWSKLLSMNITPVKPIDSFARRWEHLLDRLTHVSSPLRVAIVGGGAGGCELCFAMHRRLHVELQKHGINPDLIQIYLINRSSTIMSSHNKNVQRMVTQQLQNKGIHIITDSDVVDAECIDQQKFLITRSNQRIAYDEAFWCTQATAQSWLKETGLELTDEGFICVQSTLESVNTRDVFACGDVCHFVENPRPKAGVFAVRAGPPLTENLRRRLQSIDTLEPWIPQDQFLGLIGTGDGSAIASRGPLAMEGEYLWTLKDHIDTVWMAGYKDVKPMEMAPQHDFNLVRSMGPTAVDILSHAQMRCGGCGSKVGAQVLDRAMQRVRHLLPVHDGVVAGVGDDAALVKPPSADMLLVHTIDYFRSFIQDPYVFGQIAAIHSLSDIHAMNATPVSALALCVLPYGPEDKVEDTLVQMLAGASAVLRAENCALIGGHTSEGGDVALGLAVNGVVHPSQVLRKGPPLPGDVLIITKSIGTGTIMAADMRTKAKGAWVSSAIASMLQSNKHAAQILMNYECHACTDVTGFGVMGHLLEMMKYPSNDVSSKVQMRMYLQSVPLLTGAAECVQDGVFSTLHPQNVRCARAVGNPEVGKGIPSYPLLFDPQTSGGLLAAVPAAKAADAILALRQAGYESSTIIGAFELLNNGFKISVDDAPLIWLENGIF